MKKISLIVMLLSLGSVFSGCIDINLTSYGVEAPLKGGVYVGTESSTPPIDLGATPLPDTFVVTYDNSPGGDIDVVLNGHKIGQHFVYGPTSATASISDFSNYFRQGSNTLSVEPLAFGPSVIFDVDLAGPDIIITRGEVIGTKDHPSAVRDVFDSEGDPVFDGSGNPVTAPVKLPTLVEIEGSFRDASSVANVLELDLIQASGYSANGALLRSLVRTELIDVHNGYFCACDEIAAGVDLDGDGDIENTSIDVDNIVRPHEDGQASLLYSFRMSDVNGYISRKEYLADSEEVETLAIENAVRVAVGDSFVESLRPVIAASIYKTLQAAPIDVRCYDTGGNYVTSGDSCENWNDINICGDKRGVYPNQNITQTEFDKLDLKDSLLDPKVTDGQVDGLPITDSSYACAAVGLTDGSKLPPRLNPVAVPLPVVGTLQSWVQRFSMHDGAAITVGGENLSGRVGTVLLNRFKIKGDNLLDLDLVLTELIVRLEIPGGIAISMGMYIQRIIVDTDARVTSVNGDMNVSLENSNFVLEGVKLDDAEVCIDLGFFGTICIPLDGIANIFLPIIEGLIGDLLPAIMNPILEENLQSLTLGGLVSQPDNETSFNMQLNIAQLGTDTVTGDSFDMVIGLDSIADIIKSDPGVKPSLGPVYFDDPINPSSVFNAYGGGNTNLSVAVSSNLINQSLNAVYATGGTHFTLYKGKRYFGAQPMTPVDKLAGAAVDGFYPDTTASLGDTRIRLWPSMPPALTFEPIASSGGAARAAIAYDSATLSLDKLVETNGNQVWKEQIVLDADFELAVTINESDGVFTMGSAGPPSFNVKIRENNTNIKVPDLVIKTVVDVALFFGGDILADRFIVLDLGEIAEGTVNGTEVKFLSDKDNYQQDSDECLRFDNTGTLIDPGADQPPGRDNAYDTICQQINFTFNTSVVGVTGDKGTNLWFQMEARDPKIPPAPAIPQMDLDDDGVLDYKDNCKVDTFIQTAAVIAAGGIANNVDSEGVPSATFLADVRGYVNSILSVGAENVDLNDNAAIQALPAASTPSQGDVDWYNQLRVNDSPITSPTWLEMTYSNANQEDSDNDNAGELCEADEDRDGVYTDNVEQDNCPGIVNIGQEDTSAPAGVGDACNVRQNFVLLRSLGSKYDGGDNVYKCLSHRHYKVESNGLIPNATQNPATAGAATVSTHMNNDSYWGLGNITVACDPADPDQRWYLKKHSEATYQFFAEPERDNVNSWQLGAWQSDINKGDPGNPKGFAHLKMVKFNSNKIKDGVYDTNFINGLWNLNIDTNADNGTAEDATHPWVLRPQLTLDYTQNDCLFYNTSGWGPDFNDNDCLAVNFNGTPTLPTTYYRWGIFIGGDQQWRGIW